MRRLSANFRHGRYALPPRQFTHVPSIHHEMQIRRRICISAAYLERIRLQKRKSHPEGQRRAPSPTIQSTHQSANHTVFTPKTDPDHTDSGGLKPTAINPEHWDLVPPSGAHRLPPKCDGVWAIRRHKQPSGRALRRAGAAGKSSWQRALTAFCPTFVLQRENQPVKAGHGSCAFAQPHCGAMGGRARAHQSSKSLLVLVGRPQPVKARKK